MKFVFIDTAGIRRRGKVSSSAEVFSVMRAERSIRRANLCILVIDLTMGITAQDKRIAGLIQKARKPAIVILNKWDLVKPRRGEKQSARRLIEETRSRIFFLSYAPVLITSASTGENVDRLFAIVQKIQDAMRKRIGTGVFNRLLREAFDANPPPLVKGKRLKLFYAAQTTGDVETSETEGEVPATPEIGDTIRISQRRRQSSPFHVPEFVLFVNDPLLMTEAYRRYLEGRIREAEEYRGLPIVLTLRARAQKGSAQSRSSGPRRK
jgi:GTP-binding protein